MKKFQPFWLGALFLFVSTSLFSQVTFPINDVASPSNGYYAFTNATIVKDANVIISTGDVLDMRSSVLTHAFIQGRALNLDNKHSQLFERYKYKYSVK